MQEKNGTLKAKKWLRDRFKASGIEGFTPSEALELLLSYSVTEKGLKAASKALFERFRDLNSVLAADENELKSTKGVPRKAASLISAIKKMREGYIAGAGPKLETVNEKKDAIRLLRASLKGLKGERLLAIYLNARNEVLSTELIHDGNIESPVAVSRKAVELAIRHNARAVVFIRAVPGALSAETPSERQLARTLERAALAIDLLVHDHLIVCKKTPFSGRDEGWLHAAKAGARIAAEDDIG
ncbi:MAG: hypothetical protein A2X93_04495 [Deltaproteobacteria bacterium GWC2_56_8]|nr:MAG: hypothetical protein A2X99_00430 [Deltaproteobacteria bacterium GWB2_55_19]OGP38082.1 MAG: hypothetical protein A2X93_04495 [Deltaproteobacteria bacterium GWC2_56_8]